MLKHGMKAAGCKKSGLLQVTDQDLQPESRAKRAWLCEPKVNRATGLFRAPVGQQ